jgi:hypothetical protein
MADVTYIQYVHMSRPHNEMLSEEGGTTPAIDINQLLRCLYVWRRVDRGRALASLSFLALASAGSTGPLNFFFSFNPPSMRYQ